MFVTGAYMLICRKTSATENSFFGVCWSCVSRIETFNSLSVWSGSLQQWFVKPTKTCNSKNW